MLKLTMISYIWQAVYEPLLSLSIYRVLYNSHVQFMYHADPQGANVVAKLSKVGRIYKAEFTGHVVGEHHIDLRYGGVPVPGSPFTCNLYDIKKIRLSDVTWSANVGQLTGFTSQTFIVFLFVFH